MRIYHHVLARITLFVAAFLLSNSALCYGQSAYQFLKVTGKLKEDNAAMLAGIDEIDGGLIALTRFRGEIGFYPEEYLNIVSTYMNAKRGELNET